MRPHRILNCLLWFVILIITVHVTFFMIIPMLTTQSYDNIYSSIRRDVKELKISENYKTDPILRLLKKSKHYQKDNSQKNVMMRHKEHLLNKLHSQVFDRIPLAPRDINSLSKPIKLKVKRPRDFDLGDFVRRFNDSYFGKDPDSLSSTELLQLLMKINRDQSILNSHFLPNIEFVIVIQVHNRLEYLTILIDSLLNVKDIHNTLIIFSHDVYLSDINFLIRSIRFAPVLQIFFPFNQQVFTHEFPGRSSKDCDFTKNKPTVRPGSCFNYKWSDTYGHYRHFKFTQTKHHWTWKANFIFERIRAIQNLSLPTVFIEEDHYLTEDFIHVLRLMWKEKKINYPKVTIVTLGTYEKVNNFNPSTRMQQGSWISSIHNMGMTFDRSFWNKLKACAKMFCEFDDYNWDWSLHFINKKCMNDQMQVLMLKMAPRIYHIGECGIHHKKKECNPYITIYKIRQVINRNRAFLYPKMMINFGSTNTRSRVMKPNGGWSDVRDVLLCKRLFLDTAFLEGVNYVSWQPLNKQNSSNSIGKLSPSLSSSSNTLYYHPPNSILYNSSISVSANRNNNTSIFYDGKLYHMHQLSVLEYLLFKHR